VGRRKLLRIHLEQTEKKYGRRQWKNWGKKVGGEGVSEKRKLLCRRTQTLEEYDEHPVETVLHESHVKAEQRGGKN